MGIEGEESLSKGIENTCKLIITDFPRIRKRDANLDMGGIDKIKQTRPEIIHV